MLPELSKDFMLMQDDPALLANQQAFCAGQIGRIVALMKNGGSIESCQIAIAFFQNILNSLDELEKLK